MIISAPATRLAVALLALYLFLPAGIYAQTAPPVDLSQANLEDLMDIKITSVSKREQKLSQTAAAIYVINQEDIRRSGATNIPDLLRMAPGVDVERINANTWAISVRGFNAALANKVLVLIDGRSIYSPAFSGVNWDAVDMPLEDIERIEVVRGPGATVWGANAVNGVISIITKHSKDSKGGLAVSGAGSQTKASETLQYGGTAGEAGTYRAFAKGSAIANSGSPNGASAYDGWNNVNAGFRSDWIASPNDSAMVQGAYFAAGERQSRDADELTRVGAVIREHADQYAGSLVAQWDHALQNGSETSLRAYYNGSHRTDFGGPSLSDTFDLDFQHHISPGDRQDIVWGLGYRSDNVRLLTGDGITVLPAARLTNLFSGFLQDELRLSGSVLLTLGVKVEHNSYTGLEVEPSARLVWSPPDGKHTLWASASKSLRQPALSDVAIGINLANYPSGANTETTFRLTGNPHSKDEELRDYEVGYRAKVAKNLSFDVSTFLSFYHHLQVVGTRFAPSFVPGNPAQVIVPLQFQNLAHAKDYGGEIFVNWNPLTRWHISTGYSYLHATLREDPSATGFAIATISTDFPQNTVQTRSILNLGNRVEFDQSLYYTARLPGGIIPGHARIDLRLGRKFGDSTEISIIGQNLLRRGTTEYGDSSGLVGAQSLRSIYASVAWHFGQKTGR